MYYNSDFSLNCEKSEFARCKQYINPQFCKLNCGFKYNMQVYIQLQYIKIPFWELEEVYCKKKIIIIIYFILFPHGGNKKYEFQDANSEFRKKVRIIMGKKSELLDVNSELWRKKNIIARQTQNCEEKVRILSLYLTFLKKKLSEFWVYISQFWLFVLSELKKKKKKENYHFYHMPETGFHKYLTLIVKKYILIK